MRKLNAHKKPSRPLAALRRSAAAVAVTMCFSGSLALANPTNPTVVHGTATFAQAGSILNITNSPNAIINWGSFFIGVNELTRFIQQSSASAVLNRVIGQDPSAILGALQSNGRVFLLNPNGIVFGAGSQINVAGLVASTLNLSNEDFLNNRMRFTDGAGAGASASIESASPTSIYVFFPNLGSGGYFVNGVEGAVYDAATSTGFIVGGSPAVLGSSLKVTYGGGGVVFGGEALETPTQTLIVALGDSTDPPEAEKDKDVFKEAEDDKKKDAPVCR